MFNWLTFLKNEHIDNLVHHHMYIIEVFFHHRMTYVETNFKTQLKGLFKCGRNNKLRQANQPWVKKPKTCFRLCDQYKFKKKKKNCWPITSKLKKPWSATLYIFHICWRITSKLKRPRSLEFWFLCEYATKNIRYAK